MTVREEIKEYHKGSYTESGIEKWFNRPRITLRGRTPNQILNDGDPYEIKLIIDLARSLRYS